MTTLRILLCVFLLAASLAGGGRALAAEKSYHYGPAVVQLSGVIVHAWFWGPPNYGEDPKTDEKEIYQILVVNAPITVIGDPVESHAGLNAETFHHVRRIQLVYHKDQLRKAGAKLIGHHVTMTGTLFESFTGHHHTRVLMEVESVVPAKPGK